MSLTAQQPEVNIVRTAIEALAGVLGGTQSLHTNSMDEALALPTEKAARIALRTQQVIAHETNVAHVADPLGGSYFVEALTDEMERQAEELFAHLDEIGRGSMLEGCIQGIEDNWFQGRIADSAYELERAFNEGRRPIIGVTGFKEGNDDDALDILQITNEDEARQLKRLDQVRHDRDQAKVDAALAELRDRRRRPRAQPDARAHRHRPRVRHPRRDHDVPRRRLRPPHRGPHHLTGTSHPSVSCIASAACGWPPHEALGWTPSRGRQAIELGELVGERSGSRMSCSLTVSICHASAVQRRAALGVGGVALERAVLGVDVELDAPAGRGHGEVDVERADRRGRGSPVTWCSTGTSRRRSASASTTSGCESFGTVPPSGVERAAEPPGARTGRMAETVDRWPRGRRSVTRRSWSSWCTTER